MSALGLPPNLFLQQKPTYDPLAERPFNFTPPTYQTYYPVQGAPQPLGQFSPNYNTELTPEEMKQFLAWKHLYAPRDSGYDYDLQGAYKAGLEPDPQSGHWPDTFKKPNHPTFSNESQYAPYGDPGHWEGQKYVPPKKKGSRK